MFGLIHICTVQKRNRKKKFTYTGGTGAAVVGQTVTGVTSHKTAVVDKVVTGYVVVKTLSGTFTTTETITTATFSGTLSAQEDYQNQSKEYEYYWTDDQTLVPCRFYYQSGGKGVTLISPGELKDMPLKCALGPEVVISALECRIKTTDVVFSGTYDIQALHPKSDILGLNHYESIIKAVA